MRKMFVVISLLSMLLLLISCVPLTDEDGAIAGQATSTKKLKFGNLAQQPPSCVQNSPGLIHLWKGENSGKDSVGKADLLLHGKAYQKKVYEEGKIGQSFYFDGHDDYADTEQIDLIADGLTNKFSIEMWVYPEEFPSGKINYELITIGGYGFGNAITIEVGNGGEVRMYRGKDYVDTLSNSRLSLKKWNHILGTFTGGSLKLFVNSKVAEMPVTKPVSFKKNIVTFSGYKENNFFKGRIDEVTLSNTDVSSCMETYLKQLEQLEEKAKCGNGVIDLDEMCDPGTDSECTSSCKFGPNVQPIKVLVVKTCTTDGTKCSNDIQKNDVEATLKTANEIYARSKSKMRFIMDPETSFDFVNNDLLASHCIFQKPLSEIEKIKIKDFNGDGLSDDRDADYLCDFTSATTAKMFYSAAAPSSLIIFYLAEPSGVGYNDASGHWQGWTGIAYSSCSLGYVVIPGTMGGNFGMIFAHESGHYFCNPHTFSLTPSTFEDAVGMIKDNIFSETDLNNEAVIKNIFDGDISGGISDTPADPGPKLFEEVHGKGNQCDPDLSKTIPVVVSSKKQYGDVKQYVYSFHPDRTNIMSYFGCFLVHFSKGQVLQHYETLQTHPFKKELTKAIVEEIKEKETKENKTKKITLGEFNVLTSSLPANVEEMVALVVKETKITPNQINAIKASIPVAVDETFLVLKEHEQEDPRQEEKAPKQPICGNSKVEAGEQCDDGNLVNGDGCSGSCQIEKQEVKLQCVNPPSGIVSWWAGDNNPNDLKGGKNGVLKSGAAFSQGKVGQAFKLDGVDDYVEIADDPSFTSPAFTVSAWINLNNQGVSGMIISKAESSWFLTVVAKKIILRVEGATDTEVYSQENLITVDKKWYHVAVTYDAQANMVKMYVNGQEVSTTISKPTLSSPADGDGPLYIGTEMLGGKPYNPFNGLIDEVGFWNRALTAQEINSIYAADSGGMCK